MYLFQNCDVTSIHFDPPLSQGQPCKVKVECDCTEEVKEMLEKDLKENYTNVTIGKTGLSGHGNTRL